MNILHLATQGPVAPSTYDVFWMTGLDTKGRARVTIPPVMESRFVAAELSVARWLLEEENVCGHDKTGAGLKLFVSAEQIPDLVKMESEKGFLAPYANFLHTRFSGCSIELENDRSWANEDCEARVSNLRFSHPEMKTIEVSGIGPVEVTAHAVQKYIERFDRKPTRAWPELIKIAKGVVEVRFPHRHLVQDVKHTNPGRFYLSKGNHILVIAPPLIPHGRPQLVTVTRPVGIYVTV